MKGGLQSNHHIWKNASWAPAFWRGQTLCTVATNQSNKWVESHMAEKRNVWGQFMLLHILQPIPCISHQSLSIPGLLLRTFLCCYINSLWASHFPAPLLTNPSYCRSSKLCPIVLFIPWHWNYAPQLSSREEQRRITNTGTFFILLNPIIPHEELMAI